MSAHLTEERAVPATAGPHHRRRLFILTDEQPAYLPEFFRRVLRACPPDVDVVGAAIEAPLPSRGSLLQEHRRLGGVRALPALAVRLAGTAVAARSASVRGVLRAAGVPVDDVASPNDAEFVERLRDLRPDVVFNAGSRYLKAPVLAVPRHGCFNRHAGRLPDYRGVLPVLQALRAGDQEATVTYHSMVEEVDGGRILWEHHEPVRRHDTVAGLYGRLLRAAVGGFWPAMAVLERGGGHPIDVTTGAYYSAPTDDDLVELRRKGHRYA